MQQDSKILTCNQTLYFPMELYGANKIKIASVVFVETALCRARLIRMIAKFTAAWSRPQFAQELTQFKQKNNPQPCYQMAKDAQKMTNARLATATSKPHATLIQSGNGSQHLLLSQLL